MRHIFHLDQVSAISILQSKMNSHICVPESLHTQPLEERGIDKIVCKSSF